MTTLGRLNSGLTGFQRRCWDQRQHDVRGVLLDSLYLHTRSRDRLDERRWPMIRHQVESALRHWREPDQGLWEVRGPAQHFTASKIMCWVAADRVLKSALDPVESDRGLASPYPDVTALAGHRRYSLR
jgi:GH15 family glucan-1,4-alpha-glucosidase